MPVTKGEEDRLYWSLIIDDDWVQIGLWRVWDGKINVLHTSSTSAWEKDEDLVSGVDSLLSEAVESIPPDASDPKDVVFGIPANWANDGEVKEGYVSKIKLICTDLKLNPLGFVVVNEAIAHLLKSNEGEAYSGIIMGITPRLFEVTYYKKGEILSSESVVRSISLIDDLKEAFMRLGKKDINLTPRVVLFDSSTNLAKEVKDEIIKYDWQLDGMGFSSEPSVEVVSAQDKLMAVSLAGGAEILGVEQISSRQSQEDPADIFEEGQTEVSSQPHVEADAARVSADELGISSTAIQQPVYAPTVENTPNQSASPRRQLFRKTNFGFPRLPSIRLPKFHFAGKRFSGASFVLVVLALFTFVGGWLIFTKASIELVFASRKVRDASPVTVELTGAWNFDQKKVVGKLLQKDVSLEKTISVTGTKITGEKATGEVTLYRVGETLSIEVGTKLVGPGDLSFVLDEDTSVPSGNPATPGTIKVKVTAASFGTEYNLASGTLFTVSNYPQDDIIAKNESAFGGGTRKEVSAVSEEDVASLSKQASETLVAEAKEQIAGGDGTYIVINTPVASDKTKEDFSADVGQEATSLTLNLEMNIQFLAFLKNEATTFARELLSSKIDQKFFLRDDLLSVSLTDVSGNGDNYTATLIAEGSLLPALNEDELKAKIVGRRVSVVDKYLKSLPTVSSETVRVTPALSRYVGIVPFFPKAIVIKTNSY